MRPSELPDLEPGQWVALDCETCAKHPDDPGAHLATVSLAWLTPSAHQRWVGGELSRPRSGDVIAVAFPFNQGLRSGKAEWRGQLDLDLFGTGDPNLPQGEWNALMQWLRGDAGWGEPKKIVMHNSGFDHRFVQHGVMIEPCEEHPGGEHWTGVPLIGQVVWDSQIAERELAKPDDLIGLDATSKRHGCFWSDKTKETESSAVKSWLRKQKLPVGRYDLVPWDIIESYAANDAAVTLMSAIVQYAQVLERDQIARLDQLGLMNRLAILLDRQRALCRIEQRGLPFDSVACLAEAAKLQQYRAELVAKLPFRPTEPAARKYWFGLQSEGGLGLTPYGLTGTGLASLDNETVSRMVNANIVHAETWQRLSKIDTALDMWYLGYPKSIGSDGRLRQVFRPTKVVSGRTSVERVNLQAIPHDYRLSGLPEGTRTVRSMIRLPPEQAEREVMVELDLAQAELRAAARAANCEKMIEMIYAGVDLHSYVVTELFQVEKGDPRFFEYRQVAKRSNFSLIFDVGAKTFAETLAKQLGIYWPVERCSQTIYGWHTLFDWKFKKAVYRAMRHVEINRWIRLTNGRIRRFSDREVRVDSHKGYNQYIQGSLAEMVMDWVVEVDRNYPGRTVNMVHDSLILQVPQGPEGKAIVDGVAAIGKRLFEEHFAIVGHVDWKLWGAKD